MQQGNIDNTPQVVVDSVAAQINKTSLLDLCLQAELLVQIVMLILLLSSIWGWTIIFSKTMILSSIKVKTRKFLEFFHASKSINQLYKYSIDKNEKHPLAKVLFAAVEEWQVQPKGSETAPSSVVSANIKERVNQAMALASSKAVNNLESDIGFLATISSSAPFIGLFGTVWGIMSSFQSIAATKNTTLAVVAPGIAEALLATAFGLIAAIPAVIFYNKFSADIDNIAKEADDFKMELHNLMLRELV